MNWKTMVTLFLIIVFLFILTMLISFNKLRQDIVKLSVRGKTHSPVDMYMVARIDPATYQCMLENRSADDSLHLPEFVENHDMISYNESDVFLINLSDDFKFVIEPTIYPSHNWGILKVKNWDGFKFTLPPKLSSAVLFSIIEQKNMVDTKYKILWVINYNK